MLCHAGSAQTCRSSFPSRHHLTVFGILISCPERPVTESLLTAQRHKVSLIGFQVFVVIHFDHDTENSLIFVEIQTDTVVVVVMAPLLFISADAVGIHCGNGSVCKFRALVDNHVIHSVGCHKYAGYVSVRIVGSPKS